MERARQRLAWAVGLLLAAVQLVVPAWAGLYDLELRALHVALTVALVLIAMPLARGAAAGLFDLALVAIVLVANALVFLNWEAIVSMVGVAGPVEIALGAALALIVLEAARRAAGAAIPAMVLIAFGYVFVGPLLPGLWSHPGFPVTYIIEQLYHSSSGIYGSLTGTSATFIAVFILFGALLTATGGGQAFMDLALIAAGRLPGGPAQVATLSSAMFGMVSGSAVANVAVNAPYTIPLMRRLGYDRDFAAGVEAMSSTGGGITPPIMGIAAFIMADMLNIPYLDIIGYAVIPALLFYVGLLAGVHFEAQRVGLRPVPAAEIPRLRDVATFWNLAPLLLPMGVMFWSLGDGENLTEAGVHGCLAIIALFLLRDLRPQALRARLGQLLDAFAAGGLAIAQIAPLLVAVSMFTALLGATGVAPKVSTLILELGAGNLAGALLVAAVVPLALGAPLPVSATYVLSATLIAPALTRLGLDLVAVHMFLLYWATMAAVTPPTCTACVVAAKFAEGNWFRTAMVGMRLGFVAFVVPFFFVLNPALIGRAAWPEVLLAAATGIAGTVFAAAGLFGFYRAALGAPLRLLFVAAGICLLAPGATLELVGAALAALALIVERLLRRRRAA